MLFPRAISPGGPNLIHANRYSLMRGKCVNQALKFLILALPVSTYLDLR